MPWKRLLAGFLLVLCCTGCGSRKDGGSQMALDLRRRLMEAGGCSFHADVTADFGDYVHTFSMDCAADREKTSLEVTAPPELAGIAAAVQEGDTKLVFEGTELDFGELGHGLVTPVAGPWLLTQCWVGEYIAMTGADEDLERVTYLRGYDDEEIAVDTWLNADGIPVYAEVSCQDIRYLTMEITEFRF